MVQFRLRYGRNKNYYMRQLQENPGVQRSYQLFHSSATSPSCCCTSLAAKEGVLLPITLPYFRAITFSLIFQKVSKDPLPPLLLSATLSLHCSQSDVSTSKISINYSFTEVFSYFPSEIELISHSLH